MRRLKAGSPAALLLLLTWCAVARAALDVPFVLEVRQTGSDSNAGGFALGAQVAAPAAPTVTPSGTGGTVAAATYYCVVTYTDAWGNSVISGETAVTTSGATASLVVTSPAAATSATAWNAYFGTVSGGPYFPQGTGLAIGSSRTVTTTPPTGGTQPNGVDYSAQDAPQVSVADGVASGTTTITSATAAFTGAHVGNLVKVGTAYRHILGLANATTITVDATVTAGSSLAVVIGGGFATPGMLTAGVGLLTNSVIFLKSSATPYGFSATAAVAGGAVQSTAGFHFIGYDTTRTFANTDANRPVIKPTANAATFWNDNGLQAAATFHNLIFSNPDGKTGAKVINSTGGCDMMLVKVGGFATLVSSSTHLSLRYCDMSFASQQVLSGNTRLYSCDWHDGGGMQFNIGCEMDRCNVYNITSGSQAIQCNNTDCRISNCNFYHVAPNNAAVAIQLNGNAQVDNCIFEDVTPGGGQAGYAFGSLNPKARAFNCFYYNIKTAVADPATVTGSMLSGMIALTASPFVAPGSGNFALNATAGGGAAVRAAALPLTYPAGTSASYLDAGAVQHRSPGHAR